MPRLDLSEAAKRALKAKAKKAGKKAGKSLRPEYGETVPDYAILEEEMNRRNNKRGSAASTAVAKIMMALDKKGALKNLKRIKRRSRLEHLRNSK